MNTRMGSGFFIAIVVLLLAFPFTTRAQLIFTTNNGAITITGYTGSPTNVIIPSTTNGWPVTAIGANAFLDCYGLTNVVLDNAITTIGQLAFGYCTNLPAITIPSSVTNIGGSAFVACFNLKNITIPSSVIYLGGGAFEYCYALTNISLGNAITSIGSQTFDGCTTLCNLIIPGSVSTIGSYAFDGCFALTNIVIPNGVGSIGDGAFYSCGATNLVIPNSVTNLGSEVFWSCPNLTNVFFGTGVSQIGGGLFENSYKLTTINVDPGNPVFSSLSGILLSNQTTLIRCPLAKAGSVTIPDSITNIGYEAFFNCTNLTSVTFGAGIASVGGYAFNNCGNVTNAIISSGQTNFSIVWFSGLSGLNTVSVNAGNQAYTAVNGVLFSQDQTSLIFYPPAKVGSYTVPNGVTSIGSNAFASCDTLTNVTISASVTNIGAGAFVCPNLTNVFFLGNPPTLGTQSFGLLEYQGYYFWVYPTCYYLPGTTGWGSLLGGCPTVLWNPIAQTSDGHFGFQNHRFGFNVTGTTNIPLVIEGSTNLAGPWTTFLNGTLTNGTIYFSDSQSSNLTRRFYHIRSP